MADPTIPPTSPPTSAATTPQARADELALTEPGSSACVAAAALAVQAAQAGSDDGIDGRRRLARALWRQASTLLQAGDAAASHPIAVRVREIGLRLLEDVGPDDPAHDDVVGEFGTYTVTGVAAVSAGGQAEQGAQDLQHALAVTAAGRGPRARQAHARLKVLTLTVAAEQYAQARLGGQWDDVAAAADDAITDGLATADTLRRHVDEGPTETAEAARALQIVSRLQTVAGQLTQALAAAEEAAALAGSVADRGPWFRSFAAGLRAERDGLAAASPSGPAAPPEQGPAASSPVPSSPAGGAPAPLTGIPAQPSVAFINAHQQLQEGTRLIDTGEVAQSAHVLSQAQTAFRELGDDGSAPLATRLSARRRLALTCWVRALALTRDGRAPEAVVVGREGVDVGLALLDDTPLCETADEQTHECERDVVTAEVVRSMVDLAGSYVAAGLGGRAVALLDEATARGQGHPHDAVLRQLARARTARADAQYDALMQTDDEAGFDVSAVAALVDLADAALATARDLVRRSADRAATSPTAAVSGPVAAVELARALLLHARSALLAGNVTAAVRDVADVTQALGGDDQEALTGQGPATGPLLAQAAALAAVIDDADPQWSAAEQAAGRWPRRG